MSPAVRATGMGDTGAVDEALLTAVLATAVPFAVPLRHRFRGVTVREGMLLRGPAGWAEFAPFREYDDVACVPWLRAAVDSATRAWPMPRHARVPVNAIVPVVAPDLAAAELAASGCGTAKVKVADIRSTPAADLDRLRAVREVLGPEGRIRLDANAAWTVQEAIDFLGAAQDAVGEIEYVEQPCATVTELAAVRRRSGVRVAADESIRLTAEDDRAAVLERLTDAVDVAIVKVGPLGGVRAALRVAALGLPVVVSSAVDTSVGLAAGVAAAAALPALPYACGLGTRALLAGDVSSVAVRPQDGWLTWFPTAPQPDLLDDVRPDAAVADWWWARLRRVAALLPA